MNIKQIKWVRKILLPCLFNFYAEYIMRIVGLEEVQAAIKIAGQTVPNEDTKGHGRSLRAGGLSTSSHTAGSQLWI